MKTFNEFLEESKRAKKGYLNRDDEKDPRYRPRELSDEEKAEARKRWIAQRKAKHRGWANQIRFQSSR